MLDRARSRPRAARRRGPLPIPVDVVDWPEERFPPTVEATAYFVASEALTNVAKYAEASSAEVAIRRQDDRLVIEVVRRRPGRRGPGRGSGLRGLTDRIAALDGSLDVVSPSARDARTRRAPRGSVDRRDEERGVVFDDRAAAILRLRRRRGLITHAAVFAVVQLALLATWFIVAAPAVLLAGLDDLHLGDFLALHASLTWLRQPISDSAVTIAAARHPRER